MTASALISPKMKPSGDPVAARNSAKRKRSDETEEFNANGAAKAKFDETAGIYI